MKRILSLLVAGISAFSFAQDGAVDTSFGTNGVYSNNFGFGVIYPQSVTLAFQDKVRVSFAGKHQNLIAIANFEILNNGTLNTAILSSTGGVDISKPADLGLTTITDGFVTHGVISPTNNSTFGLGNVFSSLGNTNMGLMRNILADGTPNTQFGFTSGYTVTGAWNANSSSKKIALYADSKLLVIGDRVTNNTGFLTRHTSNGSNIFDFSGSTTDITVSHPGTFVNTQLNDVKILSDNKTICIGSFSDINIQKGFAVKHNYNGTLDTTFGTNGYLDFSFNNAQTYAEGFFNAPSSMYYALLRVNFSGTYKAVLVKFNASGVIDTTFGTNGYTNLNIDIATNSFTTFGNYTQDSDGRILFSVGNKLYRVSANGTIDNTFGINGMVTISHPISSIAVKQNNKIVVSGVDNNVFKATQLNSSTLSTNEFQNQQTKINLFPNPTSETLNFSQEISNYSISDTSGRQILSFKNKTHQINVSHLKEGVYIISFEDENGNQQTQKFIKK